MELHINNWGNSLAMRLPKEFADMLGISKGSTVQAHMVDGKLVISADPLDRLKSHTRGYCLKELMATMPQNDDPAAEEEARQWRDAPAVGKEILDEDWS